MARARSANFAPSTISASTSASSTMKAWSSSAASGCSGVYRSPIAAAAVTTAQVSTRFVASSATPSPFFRPSVRNRAISASGRVAEFAVGPAGLIVGDGGAIGESLDRRDQHRADRAAFVQRPHGVLPGLFPASLAQAATQETDTPARLHRARLSEEEWRKMFNCASPAKRWRWAGSRQFEGGFKAAAAKRPFLSVASRRKADHPVVTARSLRR